MSTRKETTKGKGSKAGKTAADTGKTAAAGETASVAAVVDATAAGAAQAKAAPSETKERTPTIDERLKTAQLEEIQLRIGKTRKLADSEAQEAAAKLRTALAQAESVELELAKKRREAERELAAAAEQENLRYVIWDGVTADSMKACFIDLAKWSRRYPGRPLTVVLNSPGGLVTQGLALYDFLCKLRADGHFLTVEVLGQAASMGGILLQAGDKRVIGPSARVLIHEVSAGTSGNVQKMDDDVALFKGNWEKLSEILAYRSVLTARQVRNRAFRKDWWLSAKEALELGFVDEILAAPQVAAGRKLNEAGETGSERASSDGSSASKGTGKSGAKRRRTASKA